MKPIEHILVPTDFGDASERALDLAIDMAKGFDAKVILMHATFPPSYYYGAYAEGLAFPVDELESQAGKALDAAVGRAVRRHAMVARLLVEGEPWERILAVSKERGADLIVMGTHGKRGLVHAILGSVAEKVVRLSSIPVMTISAEAQRQAKEKARAHA